MALDIAQRDAYWSRTRNLMIVHLVIWFFFSFIIHAFAVPLNNVSFLGWPLGYYFAAQGSLAVFVIQLFLFNFQQEKINRDFGVAEDVE
jgi:putative solute:sodium symporter small subunit